MFFFLFFSLLAKIFFQILQLLELLLRFYGLANGLLSFHVELLLDESVADFD